MPNRNGTGPQGVGPSTGRRMGPCGRGSRQGLGNFGRRWFSGNEKSDLDNEEKMLKEDLANAKKE